MARHERAETVRKKCHHGTSSPLPYKRSVGAAIPFGGPVRDITLNYVCNMRAITSGLLTSTRAHFLLTSVRLQILLMLWHDKCYTNYLWNTWVVYHSQCFWCQPPHSLAFNLTAYFQLQGVPWTITVNYGPSKAQLCNKAIHEVIKHSSAESQWCRSTERRMDGQEVSFSALYSATANKRRTTDAETLLERSLWVKCWCVHSALLLDAKKQSYTITPNFTAGNIWLLQKLHFSQTSLSHCHGNRFFTVTCDGKQTIVLTAVCVDNFLGGLAFCDSQSAWPNQLCIIGK